MKIVVAVIKDNFLFEGKVFGLGDPDIKAAEAQFVDYCRTHISNFDEVHRMDADAIIDAGYAKFGNGSVNLSWMDVSQ